VGEEPNDFGLKNSLHLVTLEPSGQGTVLNWVAHYDAADLDTNRSELDRALSDIADRLIARFGGRAWSSAT
jgi:carbon monoxide dehydrogenase subunit G